MRAPSGELTWTGFTLELAWAAGFFDGEGCTATSVDKRRPAALRIFSSVGQSSRSATVVPSVLTRFQNAVGGLGYIKAPYLDERSGTYAHQWRADSFEEAQAVVALLWKHLGPVKRAQASAALPRFREQYRTVRASYRRPARVRTIAVPTGGAMASEPESSLAWAAGLFDGEGSTELHVRRSGARTWFSLRARVSQCDDNGVPAVLTRFQHAVGCGQIEGPTSGEGYENAYKWAAGAEMTLIVLRAIWPWLGTVKRIQAMDVIETVDSLPVLRRYPWRDQARRFADDHGNWESPAL
jgi:hypothetical protein